MVNCPRSGFILPQSVMLICVTIIGNYRLFILEKNGHGTKAPFSAILCQTLGI